jgi:hypothetical protein
MTRYRAIQYFDGKVKYDEIYEGMTKNELKGFLDELVGLVIDSYEIEEIQ